MRHKTIIMTLIFLSTTLCSQELKWENLPYKKNILENISDGEVFSESKVRSLTIPPNSTQGQSLNFSIAGLHPKSCVYALKTLSLYEEYSHYIKFVKESSFNEQKQEIDLLLSHFLLPYDMRLTFKLPRITTPGTYPFVFDVGILKDLQGKIRIGTYKNRCLFYSTAEWVGPYSGLPNLIFELFSQALTKLSMEILFRISSSLKH